MHARNLLFCEGAILLLGSLATSVKQGTSINMKVNFYSLRLVLFFP